MLQKCNYMFLCCLGPRLPTPTFTNPNNSSNTLLCCRSTPKFINPCLVQTQESVFANLDSHVLERLAKIMSYVKTAGGKKLKKKERDELLLGPGAAAGGTGMPPPPSPAAAAAAARPPPVDEEDDIFGDSGTDYKPSVTASKKKAAEAAAK